MSSDNIPLIYHPNPYKSTDPPIPEEAEALHAAEAPTAYTETVADLLAKVLELTQMAVEMNTALSQLIRRVEDDHKKIHQLEGRLAALEARGVPASALPKPAASTEIPQVLPGPAGATQPNPWRQAYQEDPHQ